MATDTNIIDQLLPTLLLIVNLLSIIGTGLLIFYKYRPNPNWCSLLTIVWWPIVILGFLAVSWLIYRFFFFAQTDKLDKLANLILLMTFGPVGLAGLVALFFKPNS